MVSIITYARWQFFDRAEKSCVVVLLLVNTINVIALPVLIIRQFRVWLDAARMMLLLMINIGIAGFFSYYNSRFQCPDSIITYSACLAFWVWWRSRHPAEELTAPEMSNKFDEEAAIGKPISVVTSPRARMQSRGPPLSITIPPSAPSTAVLSRTPTPETCTPGRDRKKSFGGDSTSLRSARPPASARLSKQRPNPNHY
ncbi:hypothetical protein HWV62_40198 [Athelia sp. TMB]|nr:hypothetical protein HWV62_40198 [Athelia sp. TMB]